LRRGHANETTVCHVRKDPYDEYVGRPTGDGELKGDWGNPFIIGEDGDARTVVSLYRGWLRAHPELIERAGRELQGKRLACWCTPCAKDECHGFVLAEAADTGKVSRR